MLNPHILSFLKRNNIDYRVIEHRTTYTASQTAEAAHIPGKKFAKVVVMKMKDDLSLFVIPADSHIDFKALAKETHCPQLTMAREYEFMNAFDDCEVGAMPPFGELYNMKVYLANSLSHQDWLAFNAGSHSELIRLKARDFLALVHPEILPNC